MNNKNFSDNFVPKTKEQIQKENERKNFLMRYELFKEQNKKSKILGEEIVRAVEKITTSSFSPKPPEQTVPVVHSLNEQIETKIRLDDPLIYKNGKISIDPKLLSDLITKQSKALADATIEQYLKSHGYDNIYGGGAVGIKTEDVDGDRTQILKSVNDIIFKGDGVSINQEGKNIVVTIPGVSVLAGDPTIDFARESSVLELYTTLQSVVSLIETISGLSFITQYTDGIGGSTGTWTPM